MILPESGRCGIDEFLFNFIIEFKNTLENQGSDLSKVRIGAGMGISTFI